MDFGQYKIQAEESMASYFEKMNYQSATDESIKKDRGRLQSLKNKLE